jgi:hypothetical protein
MKTKSLSRRRMPQILLGGSLGQEEQPQNQTVLSPEPALVTGIVDEYTRIQAKYHLTYEDPKNGIPVIEGVDNTTHLIAIVLKKEGHAFNRTNIFYKDVLTIQEQKIPVLIRVKKTSSTSWTLKTTYTLKLAGIYICTTKTFVRPCAVMGCYDLVNLCKLNNDGKEFNMTDIVINIRDQDNQQKFDESIKKLVEYITTLTKDTSKSIFENLPVNTNLGKTFLKDTIRNLFVAPTAISHVALGTVIATAKGSLDGIIKMIIGFEEAFENSFRLMRDFRGPRVVNSDGSMNTKYSAEQEMRKIKETQQHVDDELFNRFVKAFNTKLTSADAEYQRLKTILGLWESAKIIAAEEVKVAAHGGRNTQKTRNNKRYKKNSRRYIRKNNTK